jgi:hypothetical protein
VAKPVGFGGLFGSLGLLGHSLVIELLGY